MSSKPNHLTNDFELPLVMLDVPAQHFIWTVGKAALFRRMTRKAPPLFLRGADIISVGPQISGVHEPQVKSMLDFFAARGFSDFLIDVGANIGLTSCQSGARFRRVHMFEPNPLCVGVLRTNSAVALDGVDYEIHEYGLGHADEVVRLRVPKSNWGGAYVESADNCYPSDVLVKKDGFARFDPANYLSLDIQLKRADVVFAELFASLRKGGASRGAVKIDVEGLETVVIGAIARSVPRDFSLAVIFENWGGKFDAADVLAPFGGRAALYSLAKTPSGAESRLGKLLRLLVTGHQRFTLKAWDRLDDATDLILRVNPAADVQT